MNLFCNSLGCLLAVFLSSVVFTSLSAQGHHSKKPNIIFILVDDMGYGDIGVFYQNQRKKADDKSEPWMVTPNLDKLAKSGAMLTGHYCGAPVCAPSRASLLSGLSQGQANVRDNQFDKAIEGNTLGNMMQRAGYTTGVIGKWGLQGEGVSPNWPAHPLKRGFDYFYGYITHKAGHEHYPKEKLYQSPADILENYTNVTSSLDRCYTGDLFTAVAKKWIKEVSRESKTKPFFLYLAYDIPHAVLELPTQAYPEGGMQWLGNAGNMISTASGVPDSWFDPRYANATWDDDKNPSTPEVPWPETYKRYATSIGRIDEAIGDLMKQLKDMGIAENTMVVFTSDNGPSRESYLPKEFVTNEPVFFKSYGPFDGIKRDVWEGGVRVPTIAVWPGKIPAASEIAEPSAFYDWMPTLANVAGLPAPSFSDGHTLLPLLTGNIKKQDRTVYVEYFEGGKTPGYESFGETHRNRKRNQMQMLRKNDTLGVRYDIKSAEDDFEIYDIIKDPGQKTNLALKPGMEAVQEKMKRQVLQMRSINKSAPRPYDSAFIPATDSGNYLIKWSFYKGSFPWLPAVENLKANKTGNTNSLSDPAIKFPDDGTMYLAGYMNVPVNGTYTFLLSTNTGAVIQLHEANLFNIDYDDEKITSHKNNVMLAAGWHPYRVFYRCKKGSAPLVNIQWGEPDSIQNKM